MPAGQERPTGTRKSAGHELGDDELLRRTIEHFHDVPVDPVEEVEMADPDDAGDHVRPAQDQLHDVVYVLRHTNLLVVKVVG
jgi:hypothetical protein